MDDLPRKHGVPQLGTPDIGLLRRALALGWGDFRAAPVFGLLVGLACVLTGWFMIWVTVAAGHTFWLVLMVFGFPLVAPFAAIATYEVSRRRARGGRVDLAGILRFLWAERLRQLPWLSALMMVVLLFWFFLGHMIFALFLGLKPMTNIMTSGAVFLSADGLLMIGMGSIIGGGFAFLLFAVCVIGLPLLMDREVDYVTALITSIGIVMANLPVMFVWAAFIAIVLFCAMLPGLFGVLVALPWLGHASWHVYEGLLISQPDGDATALP